MDKQNLTLLKAELTNDPLGRDYSTMSDAEAAADLNTLYREGHKDILTGSEMFYCTVASEYAALTDSKKTQWVSFCGIGEVDPFNALVVDFVQYLFGSGSDTIAALSAARVEAISRAQEGGIPFVTDEDVTKARNNEDL